MATSLSSLDYSILQQCMHCGMCLPTCPTYETTRREKNSPRGRIALMRSVADGELKITKDFAAEMSYCLGCLACQTACPAGVEYGHLLETARADVETAKVSASPERFFWRTLTLNLLFLNPPLLRLAGRLLRFYQKSGLENWARQTGLTRLLPTNLRRLEPQSPQIADSFSHELIAPNESAPAARFHVVLLTGCVQDLVFSDVNRDTADVLLKNGCSVHTPSEQPCCGSLHSHNGETELAVRVAKRMIDLIPSHRFDAIITNAGGCGSHLRHYSALLANEPEYSERAKVWDSKIKDIHEWLLEIGHRSPTAAPFETPVTVTYHDSCHLAHGQRVTKQPRDLLKNIPGVTLLELPEASWCCGSAGIYNITQPEQSAQLLARKIKHIEQTGALFLAQSNPGCHLQIARGLKESGSAARVTQPVSLLALAYRREAYPFHTKTQQSLSK